MSESLLPSFFVSDVSKSLRSLTKNERIAPSLFFVSDVSKSFGSLTKSEQIAQVAHKK